MVIRLRDCKENRHGTENNDSNLRNTGDTYINKRKRKGRQVMSAKKEGIRCALCGKKLSRNNAFYIEMAKEELTVCFGCYLKIKKQNNILKESNHESSN